MTDFPETPKNPVNRIDSDALSAPVLSISRDKCRLILGDIDLADFETTMGASKTITETTSQTIVSFPITRRNSNVLQVTGTDNRIWTFTAELRGDKAKEKKSFLQRLLNTGLPIPFELYMKDGVHKVLIRNLTFRLITECHIEYDIELVEYTPEYLYQVGTNLISAYPEFTGDIADASQNADEPGKSPCDFQLFVDITGGTKTKVPISQLIQSANGGVLWEGIDSVYGNMTTCYENLLDASGNPLSADEKEKMKKKYEKVKSELKEFFNGLAAFALTLLEDVVYKFGTNDRYLWNSKCLMKYIAAYPESFNAMIESLIKKIISNGCCDLYVDISSANKTDMKKIPLFGNTTTTGIQCISKELFDYLATTTWRSFELSGYLEICPFTIQILGDCINWCNGKTEDTLPPTDPRPPLPGSDPIAV